ncbi:lactonase family protein [Azohydromonas aeria]|uniref:lactonase family protein n=1 Tax=Azohydromonas aeria TaxID=2590212 RepID=UPI0012FA8E5D|nr:lactonase family protein [Azohydromonas aeria]
MSSTIVYVSNAESGDVHVLRLEPDGALVPLQQLALGGQVMPLAVSPDRRFLYAARRSEPLAALSMAIDPDTGRLRLLGEAPLPASMAHVATDHGGRWLLSASYGGNVVAVSPIGADGVAQPARTPLPTPANAHALRCAPGNRFAFSTALGGGQVMQWRFDAATGALTPNDPPSLHARPGAGPRHLAFHPDGAVVYVLNELDASVDVLALDREAGTLAPLQTVSMLPPGFSGEPWAAELRLTPDAALLFCSERRSSTLAAFRVGADGRLQPLGHAPTQAQPRGFAISPDGRFLVAAGQASHRLGVHAIDAASGALTFLHEQPVGRDPNWVEAIRLP